MRLQKCIQYCFHYFIFLDTWKQRQWHHFKLKMHFTSLLHRFLLYILNLCYAQNFCRLPQKMHTQYTQYGSAWLISHSRCRSDNCIPWGYIWNQFLKVWRFCLVKNWARNLLSFFSGIFLKGNCVCVCICDI